MPLRVTKEYATDHENEKKVHKKMSKNGHFQKVRRPTDLEVYNDAARILEELLQKRIDRDVKVARPKRNRTDPSNKIESVNAGGDNVTRCKTMPSRYRQGLDVVKKNDTENNKENKKKMKNGMIDEAGTDSTGNETEDDSDLENADVTKNRKKKSLFKRAKENLIRQFRKDQKYNLERKGIEDSESKAKIRKHKKKSQHVVLESKRSLRGHLNEDRSIDYTEVTDVIRKDPSSNTEIQSHKLSSGSISRNSFIDSIRKSFKPSRNKRVDDDEKHRINSEKGSLSIDEDGSINVYPTAPAGAQSSLPSSIAQPKPPNSIPLQDGNTRESSSLSPTSPNRISSPSSELPAGARGGTLSSTASTNYPTSDYNHSAGSLNALASVHSNILDSPGEDIDYIDEESDKEKCKSMIKYHGSEGLLNLKWLAQTVNAESFDFEIDEHSVSTRRPDGQLETVTTVTATKTVILPEVQEEEEDNLDGADQCVDGPEEGKDEIYGKIAKKLIEMADTYGADMSDPEDGEDHAMSAATIADAPLTDLEKEIIACLRAGGDKYDKRMEEHLEVLKTAVTDDAYDRFRSTVENSMGHELSWNTIALLFYATKGVVSAVGKSSKVATQAKEFTLKYISDTFVSWIMEQGGFDSMLSGSESDPNLD